MMRREKILERRKVRLLRKLLVPVLVDFLLAEDLELNFCNWTLKKFYRVRKAILDADISNFGEPTLFIKSCYN